MRRPPAPVVTRKPPGRDERYSFDVADDLLADEDTWEEVLHLFLSLPKGTRERVAWAFELAMASPTTARVELLKDLKTRLATQPPVAARTA